MNSETKFHVSVMDARLKKVKKQHDQYKKAYQHCVDDLIVLRANNKRLERENEKLKVASDKYTTLTNHIRDMKFASPYSYNYIHLVNFLKELERE